MMYKRIVFLFLIIIVVFSSIQVGSALDIEEVKLGNMPAAVLGSEDDTKLWTADFLREAKETGFSVGVDACIKSPNGYHLGAVVPTEDGRCKVWLDGEEGPVYDQVRGLVRGAYKAREFRFSPDGRRLAYTARVGDKWFMVVDGKKGPEFDGLREPYFSHDSKRICYVGFRGNKCTLVFDGKEVATYPGIGMDLPSYASKSPVRVINDAHCPVIFGPNERFAFVASNGRDKNGLDRYMVVVDGKVGPEYENIRGIEFSPDGGKVAYVAVKGEKEFVVLNGKPQKKYDKVDGLLTFSPDGKRLAYVATNYDANNDPKSFVVVDGKEGPKFYDIRSITVMFSRGGKHLSYTASSDGEKWLVVVDGKLGLMYDEIGNSDLGQVLGPNGELIYRARRGDKTYMVIDGVVSPAYDDIREPYPVFSSDGKLYAYSAVNNGRWFVVSDGVKGPDYDLVHHDTIQFTADGRLVYGATKPDCWVTVIGGVEHTDMFRPAFSTDGKHVAYTVDLEDEWMNKRMVFVDGQEIGRYEEVLPFRFLEDGSLEFLAVRDETKSDTLRKLLYRIRVRL